MGVHLGTRVSLLLTEVEGALAIAEQDKHLRKNHEDVSWIFLESISGNVCHFNIL